MYVSVNSNNEIKEVGITSNPELTSLYINDEMNPFKDWSNAKICCYKVNVNDGVVTMMTPYVDSRLIEHIDRLGVADSAAETQITNLEAAVCDIYENAEAQVSINQQQLTDLELAICEVYEALGG